MSDPFRMPQEPIDLTISHVPAASPLSATGRAIPPSADHHVRGFP
ncbi:hypothetical protein [Streptomyces sp. NPDC059272]